MKVSEKVLVVAMIAACAVGWLAGRYGDEPLLTTSMEFHLRHPAPPRPDKFQSEVSEALEYLATKKREYALAAPGDVIRVVPDDEDLPDWADQFSLLAGERPNSVIKHGRSGAFAWSQEAYGRAIAVSLMLR